MGPVIQYFNHGDDFYVPTSNRSYLLIVDSVNVAGILKKKQVLIVAMTNECHSDLYPLWVASVTINQAAIAALSTTTIAIFSQQKLNKNIFLFF